MMCRSIEISKPWNSVCAMVEKLPLFFYQFDHNLSVEIFCLSFYVENTTKTPHNWLWFYYRESVTSLKTRRRNCQGQGDDNHRDLILQPVLPHEWGWEI
jgi:hypothetical protein